MLRAILDRRLICAAFLPFGSSSGQISDEQAEVSQARVTADKFKNLMLTEKGYPTKELQSVINTTFMGTITGFVLGGIDRARSAADLYIKENQATLYKSQTDARKQMYLKTSSKFVQGGLPVAVKLGAFCFFFSSISTGLHVYRGKFDMLNHICAGGLTGFIFRINMGLKGAVAGTLLGTILGTISGFITMTILLVTGTNMNDLYEVNIQIAESRRKLIKEKLKMHQDMEHQNLRQMYEQGGKRAEYSTQE